MSNCIHLKIKMNHKLECKKLHKIISHNNCANCKYKEYKIHNKITNNMQKVATNYKKQIKSSKIKKLERNRFSLFTDDLSHCFLCHKEKDHLHEVIFGKNRQNSMKYGLVLPLCEKCHRLMHSDSRLQLEYKKRGQALFNKAYPQLDFKSIFFENYL